MVIANLCHQCDASNEPHRHYCGECGARLAHACQSCGFNNGPEHRYCGGCGQALTAHFSQAHEHQSSTAVAPHDALEQRELTVMFADFSGYTQLTNELDTEDVHRIMGKFRSSVVGIVEAYGGIAARHLGDAVMGLFGYPVAHSNDCERALRACLAIHEAMGELSIDVGRNMGVHIGVASGRVLVDPAHNDISVTGNAVNLAARLYELAKQGQTFIADSTYRAATSIAQTSVHGNLPIKGFHGTVRVHQLIGLRESYQQHRTPIVGREVEIDQLHSVLRVCQTQHKAQMVYVRGDAGIGKTRLAEAYSDIAAKQGFDCHRVLIFDFGMAINQDPLRLLVRSILGIQADSSRHHIEDAINAQVHARPDADIQRAFLNDLTGTPQSPHLRALFDAVDESTRSLVRQNLVCDLVNKAADNCKLFLLIEDLHWAGKALLDQIVALVECTTASQLVIVVTSRVDGDPLADRHAGLPMTTINLSALDAQASTSLAHQFIRNQDHIVRLCVERAGGNPLFLEQLLRSAGDNLEENLPGSVRSIVLSRMDRLGAHDRAAIQAASVIGQRFELECLRFLINNESYEPGALVKQALIRLDGDRYLFAHALVHDGVYDSLLRDQCRALHISAAKWFESRDLALHAEHLERGNVDASFAYLKAGNDALVHYRFDAALSLAERGLGAGVDDANKFELFSLKGRLCERLGQTLQSVEYFMAALKHAHTEEQTCQGHIHLASSLRVVDQLDDALDHLKQAEAIAVPNAMYSELSHVHFQRGNIYFPMGKIDECLASHEKARSLAHSLDDLIAEANALSGLGDANYQRGSMRSAYQHYQQCLSIAEQNQLKRPDVANRHMRGLARYYLGELQESLNDCLKGAENASQVGHQRAEMAARCSVGPILYDLGDFDGAVRESLLGYDLARKIGAKRFEPLPLIVLSQVALARHDQADAINLARMAVQIARETGPTFTLPWALGCLAVTTDEKQEKAKALEDGSSQLKKEALAHCHLWFHRFAIEAAVSEQNHEMARTHANSLKHFTRNEPLPWVSRVTRDAAPYSETI